MATSSPPAGECEHRNPASDRSECCLCGDQVTYCRDCGADLCCGGVPEPTPAQFAEKDVTVGQVYDALVACGATRLAEFFADQQRIDTIKAVETGASLLLVVSPGKPITPAGSSRP